MHPIQLRPLLHRGEEQIGIFYPNSNAIDGVVRRIKGVKWSQSNRCWYVGLNRESLENLSRLLESYGVIV